ncbi:hypothetical protein VXN68_14325, partial [Acinetobacter schindleri]
RDQAGATDVILDIKRLLLSPGNTSILPENIVGQSLSVGFRPLPQTTPSGSSVKQTHLISAGFYKLFIRQAIFDNSSFLKTLSINKFHDLKLIILHVSIIVIVILFLEDLVAFGGTLANLYAGISSSLVILAIIFTCKLFDNDHHKDDE